MLHNIETKLYVEELLSSASTIVSFIRSVEILPHTKLRSWNREVFAQKWYWCNSRVYGMVEHMIDDIEDAHKLAETPDPEQRSELELATRS